MDKSSKTPSLRFLLNHPAHLIACGFGSGLSPIAPGTAGTLFAWLTFHFAHPLFAGTAVAAQLATLATLYLIGIWAAHKTGQDLGEADHGSIVWDEIVPFWLVLTVSPTGWGWETVAFALFRLFDITKPQPARYFDEHVKNGFGVMTDDVVAALYSILSIIFLGHFFA